MHRIDAAGFAVGNLFTDGNPSTGTPATVVDAAWLNDLQENIAQLVEAAGIVLSKGDYTQLLKAIVTKGLQGCYFNIGTAAGTADAITSSYTPAITALANGMTLYVRAASANATTTPTFSPNSGIIAAKTIVKGNGLALAAGDIAGGGHWIELQYDLPLDKWVLLNPATGISIATLLEVPVRQTVLGGPVDTSGYPTFLPATSASLLITSQNIAAGAPFVVAAANGFNSTGAQDRIGQSTSNMPWAGLAASATNYLYVDVAVNGTLTPGSTTIAPVYQNGGTPAVTANQATLNIAQMQMFVGNGSSVSQTYRVFVGEAVTNASAVTSTVAYAYQGRYDSGLFSVTGGTQYAKTHNLGVGNYRTSVNFADDAAGLNERWAMPLTYTSSQIGYYVQTGSRNSITVATASYPNHNTSGSTVSSGFYRVTVNRGW